MKNLRLLTALFAICLLASCAKDQMALDKLQGTWTYKKASVFGITIDLDAIHYTGATLQFNKCKVADAHCNGVQTLPGVGATNFAYNISKDGKTVNVINGTSTTAYTINTLDDHNLVYSTSIDTSTGTTPIQITVQFSCVK
ncbi:MAG: hypothetical protein U0T73_11445 [Chitinophagales bacterium]